MPRDAATPPSPKMSFDVVAVRLSAHASEARCRNASVKLDTVFNTVAPGADLAGMLRRGPSA